MTQDKDASARVLLGVISSVHGIRGDVVIRSYTTNPADITAYGNLETGAGKALPTLKVVRVTDRGVIAKFDGIADRTQAETLRGTELWIARHKLPATLDGEYYHTDLIGLNAVNPDGSLIGRVITVENFGAGDLLEIRLTGTQRTEYVPFTNAAVPQIDLVVGQVTVVMAETDDEDDRDDDEPGADDEGALPTGDEPRNKIRQPS